MKIRAKNLRRNEINMAELDLQKLIFHFGQSNKADGKSPKTISWYNEMLTNLVEYLKLTERDAVLGELNVTTVREYIIHEQGRDLSPYTIQAKVRALKSFSSWLHNEDYTEQNLLANIRLPKAPIKIIETLSSEEIDKLINAQNPLTAIGSRNLAILITLLDTGLRLSELCGLLSENAHIEEGFFKVLGKGNKERLVPVGTLDQKMIWRYVFHFRPDPLTEADDHPNTVKLLLRRWGKRAGVPRLHAHLCRHTYATNFLNHRCGDVFRLQQILGHSTLEMVRRYVHYSSIQDMMNGGISSPLEHMGIKKLVGYKVDRMLKNNHQRSGRKAH
jgi:integrase/recombinase XerC/integrase/recombinase XerD